MGSLFKNQFVQGVLVFVLVVGGYTVYVNVNYVATDTGDVVSIEEMPTQDEPVTQTAPEPSAKPSSDAPLDLKGTHIMPDGSVMTGAGVTLPDAVVDDGMIKLPDGTMLEPAFDLRPKEAEIIPTSEAAEMNEVSFDVIGNNFTFDLTEIRVKKGDVVTINFSSEEGFHDWVVDEFDAATDRIDEGENSSVTFVATEIGSFEYYCSVKGHRDKGQVGTLIVEE